MLRRAYKEPFFSSIRHGARQSARVLVPIILQIVQPKSVIDIGCGDGTWLSVFHELGVDDLLGVDGEYVHEHLLQIPRHQFRALDLTKPFRIERSFDLALSLEVGEHLPPPCASAFVESLTALAPVVVFSAAIPFQSGIHHINEQWSDYWAALFSHRGYLPIDCIRGKVWQNEQVEYWYAQNTLLFARAAVVENDPFLRREYEKTNPHQLRLVHPRKYLEQVCVREACDRLGGALKRSAIGRLRRLRLLR